MPKYKFSEFAYNINQKRMPEPGDEELYIGLEHLDSGSLKVSRWGSDVVITGEKLVMQKGDVLFGRRNTYLRRAAIAPHDGLFSAHGMIFRPNTKLMDPDYFPFFISSDYFMNAAIRISVGSLSPTVNWKTLKELEFEIPDLDSQRKIGEVLKAANKLKEAYEVLIIRLDELVQSQFVEIFGDPSSNPKCWPECLIQNVMIASASNGFFAKPSDYCEDGNAGIICVGDVVNRKYSNISNLRRANADKKQFNKFRVNYGDILFCRSSLVKEGIAKASVVPPNCGDDLLFECHVIRIPLDQKKVIPEFMQAMTVTKFFRDQMMDKSKTATMTTIGQKDVITGKIFVPPMDLQMEFVSFSEQVDRSKLELRKAINYIDEMIKSIMQES